MFTSTFALFLAQTSTTYTTPTSAGFSITAYLMTMVFSLVVTSLLGGLMFYKILEKGGLPPVMSFVPIYNYMLVFKMSGKNPNLGLLFLGMFIPFVGFILTIVGAILLAIAVAKVFGKQGGFVVGLALLGVIFYPILGFGSAQYRPPGSVAPEGFPVLPPRQS